MWKDSLVIPDRDFRFPSACGIAGIMSKNGRLMNGSVIVESITSMMERGNGLGSGYAGYGIYPDFEDHYAFHVLYDDKLSKKETEDFIKERFDITYDEPMPTRKVRSIKEVHVIWRYFLRPKITEAIEKMGMDLDEERDSIVETVMHINSKIKGAFVVSSGKNMGIFKGVGFPDEMAEYYRMDEYEGYIWIAHNRFPTNSVGWWGGAHPFGILDWSVVHNGEISSYGANRRYLESFGYKCTLSTDTEVIVYLFDLFVRKRKHDIYTTSKILAAPLWTEIEIMPDEEKDFYTKVRMVYGGALLNGPFAIIVAKENMMMGLNDRIKLRPLVCAEKNDLLFIASEESAIRKVCPDPDRIWAPRAGEPVVGYLKSGERYGEVEKASGIQDRSG
ncbi:MAG TPA: hypothetical protein ENG58_03230 [Thermotogales bacterium]|nr:hypothetical protein [Thermotogales bacterium]